MTKTLKHKLVSYCLSVAAALVAVGCGSLDNTLNREQANYCTAALSDGHTYPPGFCFNKYDAIWLERNP